MPEETVQLAERLYDLVEPLIKRYGDISIRGLQGPWELNGCQVEVIYWGRTGATRCLFVQFPEYKATFDFEGKGWVLLKKDEKLIYTQSLFSKTPKPRDPDNYDGDQAFFLNVGQLILQLIKSPISGA